MGRHFSHLNSSIKVIEQYTGSMPFNIFIKAFFSKEKKYGSKDRKEIATLCYNYFRSGQLCKKESIREKVLASAFLSQQSPSDFLNELKPEWNEHIGLSLNHKLGILNQKLDELFPFLKSLSPEINAEEFVASLLIQPSLFLRVRPGKRSWVEEKLVAANVPFTVHDEDCISLANSTKAEDILIINKEVVIQDQNSQKVLDYLKRIEGLPSNVTAWDCCAASGGKSVLLHDRLGGRVRLTVTDIRETILSRLNTRLHQAGVKIDKSLLIDLTKSRLPANETFDIIICDAPCSGSGTWSRTPEQMFYFQKAKIEMYAAMQRQIITNSISSLKKESLFFYVTCSVFLEENDQQVEFIKSNFPVKLVYIEYLKGYGQNADTMFVAVFKS